MNRISAYLSALMLLVIQPAMAVDLFLLDQRNGSIVFSVDHFGSFSSQGSFPRFAGRLLIDRAHPENTTIDVVADAATISTAWPDGASLLRSQDFFDTARHPAIRFVSKTITGLDTRRFQVTGTLEIRGIRRPLTLDATLERRAPDLSKGTEIADFTVKGTLSRAEYGMVTQQTMISDQVRLTIVMRIELPIQAK